MERRELLVLLGAAAAAAPAKVDIAGYRPRFLTADEYRLVDGLTDLLLPEDGSPGAREAGVRYYIDTVLLYAPVPVQKSWREALGRVDSGAILNGPPHATKAEMDRFSATPFFAQFRNLTVEAFAVSDAGKKFFGYRGNTAIAEFPGCK
jgi:hypothetical protein